MLGVGEEPFRSLCDCSPIGIFLADTDGHCTYTNPRYQAIFNVTFEESLGEGFLCCVHPEDKTRVMKQWYAHRLEAGEFAAEIRFQTSQGHVRWAHLRSAPMFSDEGRLTGHVGTLEDITERKRAEESLRENESQYRMLIEQSPDGIHTYDLEGNFIEVNSRLCEMLGYTREELLQLNVHDLVPTEELSLAPIRFDELRAGKTLISERQVRRKDGTVLSAEISGKVLKEGVLQAFIRDITARKVMEERLRESERFAYSTLDALAEHIAVLDETGTIICTNKAWRDFAAANNALLVREFSEGANYLSVCDRAVGAEGDDAAAFAAGIRAVMSGEQQEFSLEYPCHSPTERRWFIGHVTRFTDDGPVRIVVAHENITARMLVEDKLKESEQWVRAIFEASRDGILVEYNETIVYVNKAYQTLFGYDRPEELIGKHTSLVLSPEDEERLLGFGKSRIRGGKPPEVYEFRGKRKDGRLIDLEATVSTHTIADKIYITTMIRDIAERKKAEAALRQAHDELERRVEERTTELAKTNEALQAEITERKQAEEILREHEERLKIALQRLKIALQTGKLGSWQLDFITGKMISSDICKANLGLPPEAELTYDALYEAIHPDDRVRVREGVEQAMARHIDYEAEYRNVWPDGTTHWIIARARTIYEADGNPVRMLGVTLDITERKQADEARTELLRKIVNTQEDERRRIALELHDQMGQDITAMILGLKSLKNSYGEGNLDLHQLGQLQELTDQLEQKVHNLAWELRPSALDDLGLSTALFNYMEEWSRRYRIEIDFQSIGLEDGRLPPHVATTIYRIVQEGLTNIAKHADADSVSLILVRQHDHVSAIIEDNGKGFDVQAVMNAPIKERRLGLLGMRERVVMVGGTLNIESAPSGGTALFIRIPVPAGQNGVDQRE